jgi:hypothetical protein
LFNYIVWNALGGYLKVSCLILKWKLWEINVLCCMLRVNDDMLNVILMA